MSSHQHSFSHSRNLNSRNKKKMDGYLISHYCHTVPIDLQDYKAKEKRYFVIWLSFLKYHYHFCLRKSPLPSVLRGNSHPSQGVITTSLVVVVPNSGSVVPISKSPCFLTQNICIIMILSIGIFFS